MVDFVFWFLGVGVDLLVGGSVFVCGYGGGSCSGG